MKLYSYSLLLLLPNLNIKIFPKSFKIFLFNNYELVSPHHYYTYSSVRFLNIISPIPPKI